MKIKFGLLFLSLAAVMVITFAVRQRTLNQLQAGNGTLRQQIEARAVPIEPNPQPKVEPTNAVIELSAEERNEVLRLRGQIAPLRSEVEAASNRVAELAQAKPRQSKPARASDPGTNADEVPPEIRAHQQVMAAYRQTTAYTDANLFSMALKKYVSDHGGQLPDDLTKVEPYGAGLPSGVSQRFEAMQSSAVAEEDRPYTLFAREKDPQLQSDGWWSRLYIFADGRMTTIAVNSPTPNWANTERNAETQARKRTQPKQNPTPR
jgi:hypothetical protein